MASFLSNFSTPSDIPMSSTSESPHGAEEKFQPGDTCFIIACTALVWLMIPGVGYFYSGMARSKSALSLIMLSFCSVAVVTVQVLVK